MTTKDDTFTSSFAKVDRTVLFRLLVILLSYCIVTFGQPAYSSVCSILASSVGYALIFSQMLDLPWKSRALLGFGFFFSVQAVGLFWFTYHPFSAVCGAYLLLCFLMALQFALLSILVTRAMICSWLGCLLIASFWTLLEWTRIGWCSGFYFDLVGISLTGHLATLQTASLFGVLGMSWGVLLTNACVLRAYLEPRKTCILAALLLICAPYLYGTWHVMHHSRQMAAFDVVNPPLQTLIVHSKKVPEEFQKQKPKAKTPQERALSCWNDLVQAIAPYKGQTLDLILMPEGVVPYGSTSLLFTRNEIEDLFQTYLQAPLPFNTDDILCSEDVAQLVATLFSCPLVIGLEGIQYPPNSNQARFYNSAFFFTKDPNVAPTRYDKQILVPMGEYIPLDFAKQIAAKYGVYDSFTPGNTPKVFKNGKMVIGPSVCYEETFGNLMRQNSLLGANLLVNLTDDYWFPYSTLAIQHYTHALPRTVENGAPLLRSCNFGISGAIDSLGRPVVAVEGPNEPSSIFTAVSSYHYPTLYSKFGDLPILLLSLGICLTAALIFFIKRK